MNLDIIPNTGRISELASLIATCKKNDVDHHPMSRVDELLPFAYLKPAPAKAVPDNDAYPRAASGRLFQSAGPAGTRAADGVALWAQRKSLNHQISQRCYRFNCMICIRHFRAQALLKFVQWRRISTMLVLSSCPPTEITTLNAFFFE